MGGSPSVDRSISFLRPRALLLTVGLAGALAISGCGDSPTTPTVITPPPPPVTPDPPKITCPAPQTVQSSTGSSTAVVYGTATAANGSPPVTTTCTPPAGSLFPVGQTTVTCTATDTLLRTDMCTLLVTVLAPPQLTATSFLAFGDSITWGEDGTNPPAIIAVATRIRPFVQLPANQIYPGVLQQDLVSRYRTQAPTVFNAGKPGEAITDSGTFSRFTSLTSSRRYTVVLIMEGSNDLASRDDRIVPSAIAGLQQMVRDAKSRGIRPYLATIPPMNPAGFRGLAWSLVPGFNDKVRALAASEGVTLVDVYLGFGNDLGTLLVFDGLHPSVQGYAKIADLFFAAIRQTLETPSLSASGTAGGSAYLNGSGFSTSSLAGVPKAGIAGSVAR